MLIELRTPRSGPGLNLIPGKIPDHRKREQAIKLQSVSWVRKKILTSIFYDSTEFPTPTDKMMMELLQRRIDSLAVENDLLALHDTEAQISLLEKKNKTLEKDSKDNKPPGENRRRWWSARRRCQRIWEFQDFGIWKDKKGADDEARNSWVLRLRVHHSKNTMSMIMLEIVAKAGKKEVTSLFLKGIGEKMHLLKVTCFSVILRSFRCERFKCSNATTATAITGPNSPSRCENGESNSFGSLWHAKSKN